MKIYDPIATVTLDQRKTDEEKRQHLYRMALRLRSQLRTRLAERAATMASRFTRGDVL